MSSTAPNTGGPPPAEQQTPPTGGPEGQPPTYTAEDIGAKAHTPPKPKLVFSRAKTPRTVPVRIHFPRLLPDFEPFEFNFRIMLGSDMQKKREEWLALEADKMAAQEDEEIVNECCDLLATDPQGFEDWPEGLISPGDKLRAYYNETTDPEQKYLLMAILRGANNLYWASINPREFFPKDANTHS